VNGVSLLAIGTESYGTWAYNLARSLRFFCPDIPIQLVYEESAVKHVDKSVFDILTPMHRDHSHRGGRLNPSFAKLSMFQYYPGTWDKVMFLDVDTLALADFSDLFEMDSPFKIHTWATTDQKEGVFGNMLWMKIEDMRRIFGLPTQTIPGTNSSFQVMELGQYAESIYEDALAAYYLFESEFSSRDLYMHWGRKTRGAILPDELFFNVALAKKEGYDGWKPILFHTNADGDLRPMDEYVKEGKRFIGYWGDKGYNSTKSRLTYDLLAKKYTGQRQKVDRLLGQKFVNFN